jgi:hypothetical protein
MVGLLLLLCVLAAAQDRVLLRDVQSITATRGMMTRHRRVAAVPQMACTGSHCMHEPSAIRCKNDGWDGRDVQWTCTAELPNSIRLDKAEVLCEGYDYPDDPYILAGSCGVEYSLKHVAAPAPQKVHEAVSYNETRDGIWLTVVCIFVLLLVMIVCIKTCPQGNDYREEYVGRRAAPSPAYYAPAPAPTPVYCAPAPAPTSVIVTQAPPPAVIVTQAPPPAVVVTQRHRKEEEQQSTSTAYATTRRR